MSRREDFLMLVSAFCKADPLILAMAMKVPQEFLPISTPATAFDEANDVRKRDPKGFEPDGDGKKGCYSLLWAAGAFANWAQFGMPKPAFVEEWEEAERAAATRTVKVSCSTANEGDDWQAFWEALLEHVEAMEEDHDPLGSLDQRIYENLLMQGEPGVELFVTPAEAQGFREWLEALPCYVHARPPFVFEEVET